MDFIIGFRLLLLNCQVVAVVQWKSRLIASFRVLYHRKVMGDIGLLLCDSVPVEVKFKDLSFFKPEKSTCWVCQECEYWIEEAVCNASTGIAYAPSKFIP